MESLLPKDFTFFSERPPKATKNYTCLSQKAARSYSCLPRRPNWLANHTCSHIDDARALFLCVKGCGQHYACLYMLAVHEEKCHATGGVKRVTTVRIPLTESANTQVIRTIMIARSSSEAPLSWFAHKAMWQEGLYFWGRKILEHFVAYSGYNGPAVLHAATDCQTRYLPAPADDNSSALQSRARWECLRAFKFTEA